MEKSSSKAASLKPRESLQKYIEMLLIIVLLFCRYSFGLDLTIRFEKPFVVQEIKGQIKSVVGGWPDGYASENILFQLKGPDESEKIWIVNLDHKGKFKINVPDGTYKFTIEVIGWDDAEGMIIVTRNAKKRAKIEITLNLS